MYCVGLLDWVRQMIAGETDGLERPYVATFHRLIELTL